MVGAVGAGMNQAAMLTRFVRRLDLDVVLCAGRYTLLDRSVLEELMPACAERGTSVVIGGVYNSGLLAGGTTYDYAPAPAAIRERVARLRRVCDRHGVPLAAAALRLPFGHPAVAGVLVGCRTPAEAENNAASFGREVPGALWTDLREEGLLDAAVPAPP
ncbi:aldo/keto reductase [Actinomadura viridis]|uniref:aldo/keto reductase n=1 Tax=Actinomadura viridis TaxID=58110 RepID=UPI00367606E7